GAGLYTSASYKPSKKGEEKTREQKEEALKETLRTVWASIWNLRAFEERDYFKIPHGEVLMGLQINPSFNDEDVDGVLITKNVTESAVDGEKAVYIEAQRGDDYSVANPVPGLKPERLLVRVNRTFPLDKRFYEIEVLQRSNVDDDMETIMDHGNPTAIMTDDEIKDLVYQALKAEEHFHPLLGKDTESFALDMEFKVDRNNDNVRQVFLKQARPYIN
ncbi:MAG: hypothetical protein KDD22_06040, partial [Bdellovibrionales bacterium]|nr:hypothetical protein [Bdellovibrionales bacterium]